MAYVEIHPVYKDIDSNIEYIKNKEKTQGTKGIDDNLEYVMRPDAQLEEVLYITGVNCEPETAADLFKQINQQFGNKGKIVCHHGYQSFPPELDITPAQVHQIGVEFAQQAFGDRFPVVVTTHLDKAHLHNHFSINATAFDGKKYYGNKTTLRKMRRISDALCIKYGLPIIENPSLYGVNSSAYHVKKRGLPSWRAMIKVDIDDAIKRSKNYKEFWVIMREKGYLIKTGAHIAVSPPEFYKTDKKTQEKRRSYIRLDSIHDNMYIAAGIQRRIEGKHPFMPRQKKRYQQKVRRKQKLPAMVALYYKRMYQLGALDHRPKRSTSAFRATQAQAEAAALSERIKYLNKNGIKTSSDISKKQREIACSIKELKTEQRQLYRLKDKQLDVSDRLEKVSKALREKCKEEQIINDIISSSTTRENTGRQSLNKPSITDVAKNIGQTKKNK